LREHLGEMILMAKKSGKQSYGSIPKGRTKFMVQGVLAVANNKLPNANPPFEVALDAENLSLTVTQATLLDLAKLARHYALQHFPARNEATDFHTTWLTERKKGIPRTEIIKGIQPKAKPRSDWSDVITSGNIGEVINGYLKGWLAILKELGDRPKAGHGSNLWSFTLKIWSTDLEENGRLFDLAWEQTKGEERGKLNVTEENDVPFFSGGEDLVRAVIDQVNKSLEIGSRLQILCNPRYSDPLFLSEGSLPLPENDRVLERDIIKKFDINYTNDPCAAITTKPNWSDYPLTIRYHINKYAEILSLRNSFPYIGIATANVLLFSEELRCVVAHRRSKKSRDYPGALHSFGGAFMPPGSGHQSAHQVDRSGIRRTAIREIFEESDAGIYISKSTPVIVIDEFEIQFIQIAYLGVNVTAEQVKDMCGNWEGDPVQIRFEELEDKLVNINEWTPTGWVHVLLWLAIGTPNANKPIKFGDLSGSELASAIIKRCLTSTY